MKSAPGKSIQNSNTESTYEGENREVGEMFGRLEETSDVCQITNDWNRGGGTTTWEYCFRMEYPFKRYAAHLLHTHTQHFNMNRTWRQKHHLNTRPHLHTISLSSIHLFHIYTPAQVPPTTSFTHFLMFSPSAHHLRINYQLLSLIYTPLNIHECYIESIYISPLPIQVGERTSWEKKRTTTKHVFTGETWKIHSNRTPSQRQTPSKYRREKWT